MNMETVMAALLSGLLFGAGLTISQMVNPAKVAGFLDVAGDWDPSLALVMGGALAVTAIGYRVTMRRGAPLFATDFRLPTAADIDAPLLGGAALFGVGWGLGGFCPGPAIASLAYGIWQTALFVLAMVAAMAVWEWMPTDLAAPQRSDEPGAIATVPGSSSAS
jgi:uncharacterized membrane protein YedE/YeeE